MTQTLEAVFENGTFRLLEDPALPLAEGQHVKLTIDAQPAPVDVLAIAGQVYVGLTDDDIDDVERIALDRRTFFTDR
ncbi:MAG TPA: antitoxin family protein [Herpetosiphonaceae bacterium]